MSLNLYIITVSFNGLKQAVVKAKNPKSAILILKRTHPLAKELDIDPETHVKLLSNNGKPEIILSTFYTRV